MLTFKPWPRAIILVDMNAFFASVEQVDYPELRGRPVAITNGEQGTCIITCSYEARAFGIRTGMRLKEARNLCPKLIRRPSRPERYAKVSSAIMAALRNLIADIEIFSVDEAFLDVTRYQTYYGHPERIGKLVKQTVFEASHVLCSIGISGDKTTAKFAAKLQKPNGFNIIPPWEAKERLRHVPVNELCGIANGISRFLARYGVFTCGDMENLPISILAQRFGNLGRRIWYMCQGTDPDPLRLTCPAPKTMGHGKVMPPNTRDKNTILTYLLHMSEKLGARLRRHHFTAHTFFIGLLTSHGWLSAQIKIPKATADGKVIFQLCQLFMTQHWQGEPVHQVQVTALDPQQGFRQLDCLLMDENREPINLVMDQINQRYGEFALAPARLLNRSAMSNVIAPAWQPTGHRETIF